MRRQRMIAAVVASALTAMSAGCYSRWDVPHDEVRRLDGYKAPATVVLHDKNGEDFEVDEDTQLMIVDADGKPKPVRLQSARVIGETFEGNAGSFGVVRFPLASYRTVRFRRFSGTRAAIVSVAVTGGAIILVIVVLNALKSSGGGIRY